ncbi:hypothetical protein [Methylocapsa sp. S129]|uniref:hypothetical protein n=1 Tax=Methylocapsa sp. S129 TaxID=1641869 RepID=UPI00131E551D|nr:hypothetical protein [Methylocapsa sp. S129]
MWGPFAKLLNWAFLVAGVIGLIYPAFLEPPQSLTQIITSLLHPELTAAFALRWLCVVIVGACIYMLAIRSMYFHRPITIVESKIKYTFFDNRGSVLISDRKQILRANQSNVSACYSGASPTNSTGRVRRLEVSSYCHDGDVKNLVELVGSEVKGYEIIQEFGRPMPYGWYMPLIPIWFINSDYDRNFRFIKKNLILRGQTVEYHDDFVDDPCLIEIEASQYPFRRIRLDIDFGPFGLPADLKFRRVQANGVLNLNPNISGTTAGIYIDRLQHETLRISWKRPEIAGHARAEARRVG